MTGRTRHVGRGNFEAHGRTLSKKKMKDQRRCYQESEAEKSGSCMPLNLQPLFTRDMGLREERRKGI